MALTWHFFYVRFSSIWNETDSFLSQEQIEIWLNQSPLLCCSIKGHIFVDLQITDKFHSQKSIIIFGVSNYKIVQKRGKFEFLFQKCPLSLARECAVCLQ